MPERTLGDHLRRAIRKRVRRVRELGTDAVVHGRSGEMHALRIAIKRLRYELEFVAALEPERTEPALRQLALLQERLGALADLDTFERAYETLLAALDADDARRAGIESLRDAARRERATALAAVRAVWGERRDYVKRLAASISAAVGSLSPNDES